MQYIEGFVAAVPTSKKAEYIAHAKEAARIFRDHGAIRLVECWGDDVPDGIKTSFPKAVQCAESETVVFSWAEWPSREARNAGMAKIRQDPRMTDNPMPFDASRLIYGGFQMVVAE